MANLQITNLPAAQPLVGTESVPIVQNGQTVQTTTGAIANAPVLNQDFLTVSLNPTLPNSRYFSTDANLSITDNGAQSYFRLNLVGASASINTVGNGFIVKTGASTLVNRQIAVTGLGIALVNGDGIIGNPTLNLNGLVGALATSVGSGLLALGSSTTISPVSIIGTAGDIDVANGNALGGNPTISLIPTRVSAGSYTNADITVDSNGRITLANNGASAGTVSSVSVVSANGFAGTVFSPTINPAITLSTTVTGILKGNGTAISSATSGVDYAPATTGSSILYGNAGGFGNVTIGTGLSFSLGTLTNTAPDQTVVLTGAGTTTVTGTYPSFTITSTSGTSGDVTGPSVAVNNNIVTFDGTTGKLIKDSGYSSASFFPATSTTGTGNVVLQTSPTLITPLLGTPTSGNFSTGTFTWPTFNQNTSGTAAGLSSILAITSGGTNSSATPTAGGAVYGTGTAYAITVAGTSGQVLTSAGASAPTWTTPTVGTVTSVSALTLGTTGTDLSSTVANGTTTPVITLQVPTASATNRGALSSTDWTTFNNKYSTGGALGTPSSGTVTNLTGTASININGTVGATTPSTGVFTTLTDSALTSGRVTYAGTAGLLQDSANFTFNGTTVTTANDASIHGLTVGLGGGAVATNTAIGSGALSATATGTFNVGVGQVALSAVTSGGNNTAVGRAALNTNTTASDNTAIGFNSLIVNNGAQNTAVGGLSLTNNVGAVSGVAIGYGSLQYNVLGNNNSSLGFQSLRYNTTASNLTAIGYQSLYNNTTNVATLGTITGGSSYTNGTYTGVVMTLSSGSTAITYPTATIVVAGGVVTTVTITSAGVGFKDTTTVLTAPAASIGGTGSGFSVPVATLASGTGNTAVGYQAGYNVTTGVNNTALGYQSLNANNIGASNTGIGYLSLTANTSGNFNTAVGSLSLNSNTTSLASTAIGYGSLRYVTGNGNIGIGYNAASTGTNNLTTGTNNTVIGQQAIVATSADTNSIVIGSTAVGLGSNTTVIGNSSTTATTIYGAVTARINPRAVTTTSSATPTINTDITDIYGLTALAVNITSMTTNLSGTPVDGQKLWIYFVGTAARTIAWGAKFESSTTTLPTTTVTTTRIDVGFVWNAVAAVWRCVAVA